MPWDPLPLVEALEASVAVYEPDGTLVHVNRAGEALLGKPRAALVGTRPWGPTGVPPDPPESGSGQAVPGRGLAPGAVGTFERAFQRVVESGLAEVVHVRHRSTERWHRHHIQLLDGRVHVVTSDVTGPAQAELSRAALEADRGHRRASILAAASRAMSSAEREPPRLLDVLARACLGELADCAVASALSPEVGMLGPVAVAHPDPDVRRRIESLFQGPLSLTGTLSERLFTSGEPIHAWPIDLDAFAAQTRPEHRALVVELRPRAFYMVPIAVAGRPLGSLFACRLDRDEPFDADDRALVDELAARGGLAIENALVLEAERRARERAEGAAAAERAARASAERVTEQTRRLQAVTAHLSHRRPPAEVAETVLRESAAALGGMSAAIWLLEPDAEELRMLASVGYDRPERFARLALSGPAPLCAAVRTGRPIYVGSAADYGRAFPESERRLADVAVPSEFATACVPLESEGVVIGGLAFVFAGAHELLPDERTFLEVVAHQCAQALDRTQLLEQERIAAAALAESNQTLSTIIQASQAAILLFDPDGTVRLWNPAAERMFGWTAEEAVGRVFLGVDQEHQAEFRADLARLATGETVAGLEARRRTRDGGEIDVASWAAPVARPDGTYQYLAVVVDVTDRKRAEEAVQAADRRKDEFLAVLGHELRNPLAPIMTALQLIDLKGDAAYARERAIIGRQTRHLVRLVDDLLDISRITRGKLELERRRVDLASVLARAVEMASPLLEQRKHRFTMDVPSGSLEIDADELRLAQVFQNLLTNAAKFTPPGGSVRLSAHEAGGAAVVEVEDDGPGIAEHLLPVIFEPFVQGQRVMERSQGGLGVGQALVRSLVTLHGGEVTASVNAPAPGARFTVTLPLASVAPVAAGSTAEVRGLTDGPRRRILLVDDNLDAAEMLARVLRAAGHEVMLAHDGPSALSALAGFTPDVGLLDIGLPVMDGYELGRHLRDALSAPIRLVALTGYGQEHDRDRSRDAGFDAHLVKPVEAYRLLEVVGGSAAVAAGDGSSVETMRGSGC